MKSNSLLMRRGDERLFRVVLHGHWSLIEAVARQPGDPADGVTDSVKWYGQVNGYEAYVGATSGKSYIVVGEE